MNPLLLNRFAIQGAISKPSLNYEQIGEIPTLLSVWTNPYSLMVFQGGKLHLFWSNGSGAGQNATARYLMDGTQEYMVQNLSESDRAYQWSTDGTLIYGNIYGYQWTIGISPETYLPLTNSYSGCQRECYCNPFDKKISVMNHDTTLRVLDLSNNVWKTYTVGGSFANYMIHRCEGGLTWWINSNIYCYDENLNTTFSCVPTVWTGKDTGCPYYNGIYCIEASDKGLCHYWLENGVIHFEQQLHIKLGLENLGTGFGIGKKWGVQVDPEDKNSLIFISIVDGKIYRVKNLPKNSAY